MALEAEILSNNYGLPVEFARDFLQFTKGDLEAAIKIIESSEKDMMVLKGKFISGKKMTNGAFLFFYSFQTNLPEYVFAVVSNDSGISRMKIENDWREVYSDLVRFMTANESDADLSSKIEAQILFADNVSYISSFFVDKETVDLVNVKRFLLSEISRVLMDTGIILKIVNQNIDIFRFKSFIAGSKFGLKIAAKNSLDWIVILNIRIEPVLAPIGGQDIEKIKAGDEVYAKVVDQREIVPFVTGFMVSSIDSSGAVYGKVVYMQKSVTMENTLVILEFGAGIYGKFIIGGRVRILVKERAHKNDQPKEQNLNSLAQGDRELSFRADNLKHPDEITHESGTGEGQGMDTGKDAAPRKMSVYMVILISAAVLAAFFGIMLWLFS